MASATRRLAATVVLVLTVLVLTGLVLTGCDGGASPATSQPSTTVIASSTDTLPLVGEIDDAVAALETKLGAPQEFFEINATAHLVNLIVALNDGKVAQPWVYLDGELSSTEGSPANGFTFASAALDFDPDKVLGQIQAQLPQSSVDLFFIEGGAGATVRYSVAVTSQQGGQLVVVVGPDGTVQSVNPS